MYGRRENMKVQTGQLRTYKEGSPEKQEIVTWDLETHCCIINNMSEISEGGNCVFSFLVFQCLKLT